MRRFVFLFRTIIIVVQWLCGEWLRKTIRFPIFWIVLNVGCNSVQFVCVPDNMVMKSGLPRKWNVVQVGISGNGGFKEFFFCFPDNKTKGSCVVFLKFRL